MIRISTRDKLTHMFDKLIPYFPQGEYEADEA
jgi:hypothetical protein